MVFSKKSLLIITLACLPVSTHLVFGMKRRAENTLEREAKKHKNQEVAEHNQLSSSGILTMFPNEMLMHIAGFIIDPNKPCAEWKHDDNGKIVYNPGKDKDGNIVPDKIGSAFVANGDVPLFNSEIVNNSNVADSDLNSLTFIVIQDKEQRESFVSSLSRSLLSIPKHGQDELFKWAFKNCDTKSLLLLDQYISPEGHSTASEVDGKDLAYYAVKNNNRPVLTLLLDIKPSCLFTKDCILNLAIEEKNIEFINLLCPFYAKFFKDTNNTIEVLKAAAKIEKEKVLIMLVQNLKALGVLNDDVLKAVVYHDDEEHYTLLEFAIDSLWTKLMEILFPLYQELLQPCKKIVSPAQPAIPAVPEKYVMSEREACSALEAALNAGDEAILLTTLQTFSEMKVLSESVLWYGCMYVIEECMPASFLKMLIEHGAPVNKIFRNDEIGLLEDAKEVENPEKEHTLLNLVVDCENKQLAMRYATLLMDSGADASLECRRKILIGKEGFSPIEVAVEKQDKDLSNFLKYYIPKLAQTQPQEPQTQPQPQEPETQLQVPQTQSQEPETQPQVTVSTSHNLFERCSIQ